MHNAKTIGEALKSAAAILKENSVPTPELDARILLETISGFSHAQLISQSDEVLSLETLETFFAQIEERISGKPVHRILQMREFYGRVFKLNEATLIPRPDTEILVEETLAALKQHDGPLRTLEIGTGSGAIAITLACENPNLEIIATDVSPMALAQARQNALTHGVADKVSFVEADMFDGLSGRFDAIVSNPPYIPSLDIASLQQEVRNYDPMLALDGGEDGLEFYHTILGNSAGFLKPDGFVALEIGIGQSDAISEIARQAGFSEISKKADLSGVCRVIIAR